MSGLVVLIGKVSEMRKVLIALLVGAVIVGGLAGGARADEPPGQVKRYAVIEDATGNVPNVVVVKEGDDWTPPPGHSIAESAVAERGGRWTGTEFTPADHPAEDAESDAVRARLIEAIEANRLAEPWGPILYDFAVVEGLIEQAP